MEFVNSGSKNVDPTKKCLHLLFIVIVPRPHQRNRSATEDHGLPEAGRLPRPILEVVKGKGVAKERAAQRVGSWSVRNEIRGILGQMTVNNFQF